MSRLQLGLWASLILTSLAVSGCGGTGGMINRLNPFGLDETATLPDGPVTLRQLRDVGGERLGEDEILTSLAGKEFTWQPIGLGASGIIVFGNDGRLEGSIVSSDGLLTEIDAIWVVERGQRCTKLDNSTACFEVWRKAGALYEFDVQGKHRATYKPSR